jgi:hypothetical protein
MPTRVTGWFALQKLRPTKLFLSQRLLGRLLSETTQHHAAYAIDVAIVPGRSSPMRADSRIQRVLGTRDGKPQVSAHT